MIPNKRLYYNGRKQIEFRNSEINFSTINGEYLK
jgi:hypothetical protein